MEAANYTSTSPNKIQAFEISRSVSVKFKTLHWLFTILLLVLIGGGSARAQYLGFAANSGDGTVSVFAIATTSPAGNQDHLIATVSVGKNPVRIAVTPSPNRDHAYVTNQGDNSLWVVDVTDVSQGMVTAQNVTSNSFGLNQPGGIAIVNVPSGANASRVLAFIANQGNNAVSIIDTTNNTLFGIVSLGSSQAGSTTLPEVAATPDGTQVFVTYNQTGASLTCDLSGIIPPICEDVWMIDATSVKNGGTATDVTPPTVNDTGNLFPAQGISTAQYTDSTTTPPTSHTLVAITESETDEGYGNDIWVLDRVAGSTVSTREVQINSSPGGSIVGAQLIGVAAFNSGTHVDAEVISETLAEAYLVTNIDTTSPSVSTTDVPTGGTPTSLAVTPDGRFAYVTASTGPGGALIDPLPTGANASVIEPSCVAGTHPPLYSCGNASTLSFGNDPTGLAISALDKDSAPVVWFAPSASGGFDIPTLLAHNSMQSALGVSIVGAGQVINTSLSFGGSNSCTILNTQTTAGTCPGSPNAGTNAIGGSTTFPSSGIFPITILSTSTDSQGNATQGMAQQTVKVGANCSLGSTPTSMVPPGQAVSAKLTCTAPGADALSGAINWGDGKSDVSPTVNAAGTTMVTLNFPSHSYRAAGTYAVSASVADTDAIATVGGGVTPASVTVVVGSCSLSGIPTIVESDTIVTARLNCTVPAADSLTATVDWGDGIKSPPSGATTDSSGSATVSFSHSYSSGSNPTFPVSATATDTRGLSVVVVQSPIAIQVATAPAITLTPPLVPFQFQQGQPQSTDVVMNFNGGPGDSNMVFSSVACAVSPEAGAPTKFAPTCLVSSQTVILDGTGIGAADVSVHLTGSAAFRMIPQRERGLPTLLGLLVVLAAMTLMFFGVAASSRQLALRGLTLVLLAVVATFMMDGCTGGGGSSGSTATVSKYMVTLTASSNSVAPPLPATGSFEVDVTVPNGVLNVSAPPSISPLIDPTWARDWLRQGLKPVLCASQWLRGSSGLFEGASRATAADPVNPVDLT